MNSTEVESNVAEELSTSFAAAADRLLEGVVTVRSRGGSGSGVVWDASGLILTNNHVVRGQGAVIVLQDGTRLSAEVIGRDPASDLAALRAGSSALPAVEIGDSDRVRVGEIVLAAGSPLGVQGTVTMGVVTSIGHIQADGDPDIRTLIRANVSLAPGNSGGPLANASGRVIGINTMIGPSGVALAIPTRLVRRFLTTLRVSDPNERAVA